MGVVSSRMTTPPSTGHEGTLNGLMRMKIICYVLHTHHISTTMNTSRHFWNGVLDSDSTLHHHHHHNKN